MLAAKLRANGSWTYRVPSATVLPSARYRVTAYWGDGTSFGNSAPRRSRVITFRLS